jgi:hypothetical protein
MSFTQNRDMIDDMNLEELVCCLSLFGVRARRMNLSLGPIGECEILNSSHRTGMTHKSNSLSLLDNQK